MKKNKFILIIIGVIMFLYYTYPWVFSAGGLGSLERYDFNVPRKILTKEIDSLIINDEKVGIPSTEFYNLEGTGLCLMCFKILND